jgi:hypothetical protein
VVGRTENNAQWPVVAAGQPPALPLRDGAIVPAGKVIQSTADFSLRTLTLFVSLDAEGKAQGQLYQDAGDGYGYTEGEYALVNFSADTSGNAVRVTANVVEGDYPLDIQQLEIKLVTDSGVKTARGKFGAKRLSASAPEAVESEHGGRRGNGADGYCDHCTLRPLGPAHSALRLRQTDTWHWNCRSFTAKTGRIDE